MDIEEIQTVSLVGFVGYIIAVIAATTTATILMMGFLLVSVSSPNPNSEVIVLIISMFLVIGFFVGISAWPGFIVIILVANYFDQHFAWFYIATGVLNAFLAHVLMAMLTDFDSALLYSLALVSLPSGAMGGYAYYWYWSHRNF